VRAVRAARQQLSAFLLRHERTYPDGRSTWTKAHRHWLAGQSFVQPAQQIVLEEYIEAVRVGEQRRDRVDGYLRAQIPNWSLFPLVQNLCALRGLDMIAGAGLAAAIGDPSRFATAPDFMAYLGLVPSEQTSGPKRRIGAITKAGDIHARTLLIEAAHSYRFPARLARNKLKAVDAVPDAARAIAWKAQTRLCQRYHQMMARGKLNQVVVTAIARELAGFVWSIACITSDPVSSDNTVTELYDEVTALDPHVETVSEEVAQQVQQITLDTGRRPPRAAPPTIERDDATRRPTRANRAASAERSRTG
jgi:transposase